MSCGHSWDVVCNTCTTIVTVTWDGEEVFFILLDFQHTKPGSSSESSATLGTGSADQGCSVVDLRHEILCHVNANSATSVTN